ncbi:hypothetical protein B0T26DRAFT_717721 [Lasiosphaeria miniovina]|uniref:Uncharacterized protein n=1 Tax=Lasiosphaeria miniovina TaxID=1954250 RepID=A0AA40AD31_9PEZI|nr:uncharacterized protein B0T26DRAFT_717721 [Lasiosphaeria miniovina]KAK0713544.1 hypothetical protein B0T26DRAFT_717721 [Lasiosphaeria miniovina]
MSGFTPSSPGAGEGGRRGGGGGIVMAVVPSIVEPVSIVTSAGVADVAMATTPSPDEPSGPGLDLASPTTALRLAAGYGRRSHRKSRTGCARCKARKIKASPSPTPIQLRARPRGRPT